MHLTRTGYNVLVAIWLLPLIVMDFVGNTIFTEQESDYFYYKTMADGLLLAYALYQAFGRAETASARNAARRVADHADEVVSFERIGAAEYIYCALLVVYSCFCWYSMHTINKNSTGMVSIVTLVWSFMSLAVGLLSAIQFYHLKSGAIVELKHKIVQ